MRRTRIVATLGPACRDPSVLVPMLQAGVNVVRINCSHSSPQSLKEDIRRVRAASAHVDRPVAVLVDLQGPKIRVGPMDAPMDLPTGSTLTLVMDEAVRGAAGRVGTTWPALADDLSVEDRVLLDDGALEAVVTAVRRDQSPAEVDLRFVDGGRLSSHKGINLPGLALSAPALTEKDLADLEAAVEEGVDYVALSFVRQAGDVDLLRGHLERLGHPEVPICAKIEKPQALMDLDGILARVDAIMVARGDLGVEMPLAQVPVVQKQLIQAANRAGVLVITATQMLESMRDNPRPTRAEVTDVCNAVLDGTDAVMLSAETAAGAFPVGAVRTMDEIATTAEASGFQPVPPLSHLPSVPGVGSAMAHSAAYAVREVPRPLVVFTCSGATAIILSKSRPSRPIYALTPHEGVFDRLALAWGVTPVRLPEVRGFDALLAAGEQRLLDLGLVEPGTEVVVLVGTALCRGGSNTLSVIRVGAARS